MSQTADQTRTAGALIAEARTRDAGTEAVIATDMAGNIVYWNELAASLYGWSADEAIGRNILDVTPTYSTADEAGHIMEQLRRGQTWTGEFIVRHRDRTPIQVHVTDVPVRYHGTLIGMVGVSRPKERPAAPGTNG